MSCERIRPLLDDYLDRELASQLEPAVAEHLEGCARCRHELSTLETLRARAGSLPSRIEPDEDLWPGIAERLARRSTSWSRWGSLAAALLLLVALALGTLVSVLLTGSGEDRRRLAGRQPAAHRGAALLLATADLAHVEDRVLATRRDLLVAVERQRGRLEPQTVAAIEASVHDLHRAIGEIRLALEDRPTSRRLNLLLADHYQHESELLKRLQRL